MVTVISALIELLQIDWHNYLLGLPFERIYTYTDSRSVACCNIWEPSSEHYNNNTNVQDCNAECDG